MIHLVLSALLLVTSAAGSSWWSQHSETLLGIVGGAIVTVVVGGAIAWKQWQPKRLQGRLLSYAPLLPATSGDLPPDLRVSLGDAKDPTKDPKNLRDPRVAVLRVFNPGKRPIDADDFDIPLTVEVKSGELILATVTGTSQIDVYERGPLRLSVVRRRDDQSEGEHRATFERKLLNPGDWIDVQLLIEGGDNDAISVGARISGVSRVTFERETRSKRSVSVGSAASIVVVALAAGFVVAVGIIPRSRPVYSTTTIIQSGPPVLRVGSLVLGNAHYATLDSQDPSWGESTREGDILWTASPAELRTDNDPGFSSVSQSAIPVGPGGFQLSYGTCLGARGPYSKRIASPQVGAVFCTVTRGGHPSVLRVTATGPSGIALEVTTWNLIP
jgi:hypothetical protein